MTGTSIWDQVLSGIESKIGSHAFHTWFKPTALIADQGRMMSIRVPNALFAEWLPKHYSVVLSEALRDVGRSDVRLIFVPETPGTASSGAALAEERLPAMRPSQVIQTTDEAEPPEVVSPAGLNPRYTFDSFIVGPSNQFAHAACRAVAEAPSRSYNPLFIYGGVGLGKTHLMHAIGH